MILAGLGTANSLRADIIYTNFGTGDSYSAGSGLIVTHDGLAWSSVALAFTPYANYNLSSIEFAATGLSQNGTDSATLAIFAGNNGQPGSTPLESFAVSSLRQFGGMAPVITVTSVAQPLLLANTQYWIGMNAPAGSFIVWNQNTTLAEGFSQTDGSGNWSVSGTDQGAVKIDGNLANPNTSQALGTAVSFVPEPNTWWLMAAGLSALAASARHLARPKPRPRFPHLK